MSLLKESILDLLPLEVLEIILSFFKDPENLSNIAKTCNTFKHICYFSDYIY